MPARAIARRGDLPLALHRGGPHFARPARFVVRAACWCLKEQMTKTLCQNQLTDSRRGSEFSNQREDKKMKIRGLVLIMVAVAFSFAPQFVDTSSAQTGAYSAKLISPAAGEVLRPGDTVRVEWVSKLPNIDLRMCEAEVWLSLDGGRSFTARVSPWMDGAAKYFYWTVPNWPTKAAILDIRFGCEQFYPESYAPQPASTFVIARQ